MPRRAAAIGRNRTRRPLLCSVLFSALVALTSCAVPAPPPPASSNADPAIRPPIRISAIAANTVQPSAAPPDVAVVHPGTGVFTEPAPTSTAALSPVSEQEGEVTLNFVDADIREVVRSVLGDVLHLNYVVDPKIQATITVQTSRPLRRQDVLPMLQEVLRASGLVLVESADVYRIVPTEEAARNGSARVSAAPESGAGGLLPPQGIGGRFNVQVLPLKFAGAADLLRTVEPFLPKGAVLEADTVRNLLILSGTGQDLATVLDLVRTFDVDWLSGMSYAIVPLQTGSARAIADELALIFGPNGTVPLASTLRFAPLERMNAILVVSPQRAYLDQARQWVERLDRGDDENTPRLFEYHVQNSRAADLAKVLSALLTNGQVKTVQPQTAPGTTATQIGGGASNGSSVFGRGSTSSSSSSLLGPSSQMGSSTQSTPGTGALGTGALGTGAPGGAATYAAAAAPPSSAPTDAGDNGAGFGGQPSGTGAGAIETPQARIVADEKNNTLVIFARPRVYHMIEDALKHLDVVPLQVLIEATIAEVTLTDDLQFGLQWLLKPGKGTVELSGSPIGAVGALFPGFNAILGNTRANVVLSALSNITTVNVISSPQVLVLDHNVATLQVGSQVPIPTAQVQSTITTGAPVVNTIDYRDTGVILRVSPRVNSNGLITLDIAQEVSDVATTTVPATLNAPTFNQRRIESTVTVQDGETIALGGLIKDNGSVSKTGVPFLSDIPILGALFRENDNSKTRTELLVLLSPKVVHDAQEARQVTDELRRRLQALQPLVGAAR
jgi:general secretion pathway protein D